MNFGTAPSERFGEAWAALTALVAAEGSAREPFVTRLCSSAAPMRDLADAVHGLCMLHGRHPGVIDTVAQRAGRHDWLDQSVATFAVERAALVSLVAAVGPLPSTPGQAESEAAIAAQRHALDMLVASDRRGCSIGAGLALLLDWATLRRVLDAASARLGLEPERFHPPVAAGGLALIAELADTPAFERAMLFGAQQLLAQHRALWQLLESRAVARDRA